MLGQADLTLELLPLCLGGEGHVAPEDNINLSHLLISIRIFPMMITSPGFLRHLCCWGVASSFDPGKFCTPLDHAPWCSESHTTSLRQRDVEKTSSLSALRIAYRGIHDLFGPYDRPGQQC
jgi:hypothetical protein